MLVGLGNPGGQYSKNRHNFGFMLLDYLGDIFGAGKWRKQFSGEWCKITIDNNEIILLKPQTFMNLSGASVQSALAFFRLNSHDICVAHDEIDISFGQLRMKCGGGSGGHNGIKDIDSKIGKEYWRLRLGVGHPGHRDLVSDYVLSNFSPEESAQTPQIIKHISDNIVAVLNYAGISNLNYTGISK